MTPEEIIGLLERRQKVTLRCPWHDDRTPSASICQSKTGDRWRFTCFTCNINEDARGIAKLAGIEYRKRVEMPARTKPPVTLEKARSIVAGMGEVQAEYAYGDSFRIFRYVKDGKKKFSQWVCDSEGWYSGVPTPRPLYRADELAADRIVVVEGEKCVEALRSIGVCATTSSGGSTAASLTDWSPLAGKKVVIWPDNDGPGMKYAEEVKGLLAESTVSVVDVSGLGEKEDVADLIEQGDLALVKRLLSAEAKDELFTDLLKNNLPKFPLDVLPEKMGRWVVSVSHQAQVPPCYPAAVLLGMCSAAIHPKFQVRAAIPWVENTALWMLPCMPSGSAKGVAMAAIKSAFDRRQHEMWRLHDAAEEEKAVRLSVNRDQQKALKKCMNASDIEELRRLASEESELLPKRRPQLYTSDASPAMIATLLGENDECLSVFSTEGHGLFATITGSRWSGSGEYDVFNQSYTGDSVTVNRKGDGRDTRQTLHLSRPSLAMVVACQPGALEAMAAPMAVTTGFHARWLFSFPEALEERDPTAWNRTMDVGEYTYASDVLYRILGIEKNPDGSKIELRPTAALSEEHTKFQAEVHRLLRDMPRMNGWISKMKGNWWRLTAVLHVMHSPDASRFHLSSPVEARFGEYATRLMLGYFLPHARRAYEIMSISDDTIAGDALEVWKLFAKKAMWTMTDLTRALPREMRKRERVQKALDELVVNGYVDQVDVATGGRPKVGYRKRHAT